jgi:hypothetical protein
VKDGDANLTVGKHCTACKKKESLGVSAPRGLRIAQRRTIRVPEVRDEAQLGRGHGVVSREGHVELEHATFVHGVLGTLEIDAPVVEVGIVRDFGSKALHRIRHKFCCKQHACKAKQSINARKQSEHRCEDKESACKTVRTLKLLLQELGRGGVRHLGLGREETRGEVLAGGVRVFADPFRYASFVVSWVSLATGRFEKRREKCN